MLNPTTRSYTYYSSLHTTHTRIDYILCSTSLTQYCEVAEIGPRFILNHLWVTSSFLLQPQINGRFCWSMPRFLLYNELSKQALEGEIKQYFELNLNCGVAVETVWDAFKAVLRGQMMSLSLAYKKEKNKIIMEIKSKIQSLERLLKYGGNKTRKLNIARKKLELYETSKIKQYYI